MSLLRPLAIATSLVIGCGGGDDAPPSPAPTPLPIVVDAAVIAPPAEEVPSELPQGGMGMPAPTKGAGKRTARPIEVMLRSSPAGAQAFVDGVLVGTTPTFWQGETGAEHEFTFVAPKHAYARYRFWPVQTGVLHARLEPISGDVDAGVPPSHLVAPTPSLAPPPSLAPDVIAPTVTAPDIMPGLPPVDAAP